MAFSSFFSDSNAVLQLLTNLVADSNDNKEVQNKIEQEDKPMSYIPDDGMFAASSRGMCFT